MHTIYLDISHKVLPKTGNGSTLVRLWYHTLTPSAACSGDANLEDNCRARFQGSHTSSVFLSSLAPDDLRCVLPPIATAVYRRASCWTRHPRPASRVCISSELPQPHSAEGSQQPAAATHYIWNTYTLIVPNLKKVIIDMGSKESYSKVQSTQLIRLIYYFLLWKDRKSWPHPYVRGESGSLPCRGSACRLHIPVSKEGFYSRKTSGKEEHFIEKCPCIHYWDCLSF